MLRFVDFLGEVPYPGKQTTPPQADPLFALTMTFTTGSQPLDVSRADSGLAEWSSRIKTLQTEGDADEEAEQQRLEEEIAAARLARQRRSHGLVYSSQFASSDGKGFCGYILYTHTYPVILLSALSRLQPFQDEGETTAAHQSRQLYGIPWMRESRLGLYRPYRYQRV